MTGAFQMPWIVCLCGSTRFQEEFTRVNYEETLEGRIVLTVGCFPRQADGSWDGNTVTVEQKARLDQLHFKKIRMADDVFIINVDGYVGESTRNEINYALQLGKPIRWLEGVPSENYAAAVHEWKRARLLGEAS